MSRRPDTSMHPTIRARPAVQASLFVGVVLILCLALSVALPHRELTPLIAALLPTIAVALTILVTTRAGQRRAAWATVGFRRPTVRSVLIAVALPVAVASASFAIAAALGVVQLIPPNLNNIQALLVDVTITATIFTLLFLAEEIGWRGYLLPRLATIMGSPD